MFEINENICVNLHICYGIKVFTNMRKLETAFSNSVLFFFKEKKKQFVVYWAPSASKTIMTYSL